MEINWEKLESDAQQTTSVSKYDTPQRTIFLKVKPGIHKLRILPTGNKLDSLPYMRLSQHTIRVPGEGGRMIPTFMLCWNFLRENLDSKATIEEKKNNSILSYLTRAEKMTNEDLKKFGEFGCPFCKAFAHLDMHGVEKEIKNGLLPKDQWIWNVIWRRTQYSGDGKIYVWGISKTHFNSVITAIKQDKQAGHFTLDPDKGFDLTWNATGENLQRRYAAPMFDRNPSPLGMEPNDIPFDLAEVMANSCKTYQEMINTLKLAYGAKLRDYAYIIPGDIAVSQAYPQTNNVVQSVSFQQPEPIQTIPPQVTNIPPQVFTSTREDVGGGYYKEGGFLYDPSGKKLF